MQTSREPGFECLAILAEHLGAGVMVLGADDALRFVDAAGAQLLGVASPDALKQKWTDLRSRLQLPPPGDRTAAVTWAVDLTAGQAARKLRVEMRPVPGPAPQFLVLLRERGSVAADDDQLLAAGHAAVVGFLSSKIVHDLNGPANNIQIALSLLEAAVEDLALSSASDAGTPLRLKRYLTVLKDEMERLGSLIRRIPTYTVRAREDLMEEVDFRGLLEEVLLLVKHEATARQIKRDTSLAAAEGQLLVRGSRGLLRLALLGTVVSLVEAIPEGGALSVEATHDAARLRVVLAARGVASPENIVDAAQMLFPRIGANPAAVAAARVIVERHGGELQADAAGSRISFHISLPLVGGQFDGI